MKVSSTTTITLDENDVKIAICEYIYNQKGVSIDVDDININLDINTEEWDGPGNAPTKAIFKNATVAY